MDKAPHAPSPESLAIDSDALVEYISVRYQWDQVRRAAGARRIADHPAGQLWIAVTAVILGVKPWIKVAKRLAVPIRVPSGRWMWLADVSELRVISEIFLEDIYDVPALPASAQLILDLGANAGAASDFFAERYRGAQILAYEADPRVAQRMRRNLRGRAVEVHAAAVSSSDGPVELRRPSGMSWATSAHASDGEPFVTAGVTLDEIIGDRTVDVLKMDIEGSEYAAVKACTKLGQVNLIIGEFHPIPGVTADDFFGLLEGFDLLSGGGTERATFVARRVGSSAAEK